MSLARAQDPTTSPAELSRLVLVDEYRLAIAANPNASPRVLRALLDSKCTYAESIGLIEALLRNPALALIGIEDPAWVVRFTLDARKRLGRARLRLSVESLSSADCRLVAVHVALRTLSLLVWSPDTSLSALHVAQAFVQLRRKDVMNKAAAALERLPMPHPLPIPDRLALAKHAENLDRLLQDNRRRAARRARQAILATLRLAFGARGLLDTCEYVCSVKQLLAAKPWETCLDEELAGIAELEWQVDLLWRYRNGERWQLPEVPTGDVGQLCIGGVR